MKEHGYTGEDALTSIKNNESVTEEFIYQNTNFKDLERVTVKETTPEELSVLKKDSFNHLVFKFAKVAGLYCHKEMLEPPCYINPKEFAAMMHKVFSEVDSLIVNELYQEAL